MDEKENSRKDVELVYVTYQGSEKEYCFFAQKNKYHDGDIVKETNIYGEENYLKVTKKKEDYTDNDLPVDPLYMKYLNGEVNTKELEQETNSKHGNDTVRVIFDDNAEHNPEEIVNLNLFNVMADVSEYFSYLEYHSDLIFKVSHPKSSITLHSLIKRVEIDNQTGKDFDEVSIHFHFSNSLFQDYEVKTTSVRSPFRNKVDLKQDVVVDGEKLYHLNGMDVCQLEIVCYDTKSGQELDRIIKVFKVLPIRQCSEDFSVAGTLFSKYCITGFSKLKEIHQLAIQENDGQALIGYQNQDVADEMKEINSIFKALHNYGIAYSNPPHSAGQVQDVRLPIDVLKDRQGTCLDLSILFCSALLEVGYHPILILVPGHALIGVFLEEEDSFDGFISKNSQELYEKSINKDRSILLINAVEIESTSKNSYQRAKRDAEEYVFSNKEITAVDVYSAQVKGSYAPIPMPQEDTGEIDFEIKPVKLDETEIAENEVYIAKHIEGTVGKDRFSTWERKLLDLTTANRLVDMLRRKDYYSDPNLAFIGVEANLVFSLVKKKSLENSTIYLNSLDEFAGYNKVSLLEDQILKLAMDKYNGNSLLLHEYSPTVRKIIAKNKTAVEETGSSTLYLAMGTVSFYDLASNGGKTKKIVTGPLLLLPIDIKKKTYGNDFEMTYDIEDCMINQTFFEYVKLKLNLDYSGIYAFDPQAERLEDVVKSINDLNHGVVSADASLAVISNFTFNHYVMWQDIKIRKEQLRKNQIVSSLLQNKSLIGSDDYFDGKSAETLDQMTDFAAPLPYDSTQLKAIIECGRQKSFILDGPPGTGKSQTIVNMIVNAMYQGKTVLFVAEKAAALDVVRNRLFKLGLDRFAMGIYGSKFTKATLFENFRRSYNQGMSESENDFDALLSEIGTKKQAMRKELDLLHEKTESEGELYSLYDAIVNYKSTIDFKGLLKLKKDYLVSYSPEKDDIVRNDLSRLIKVMDSIPEYFDSPMKSLKITSFGFIDQEEIKDSFAPVDHAVTEADDLFAKFILVLGSSLPSSYRNWQQTAAVFDDVFHKDMLLDKTIDAKYYSDDTILNALNSCEKMTQIRTENSTEFDFDKLLSIDTVSLKSIVESKHGFFADILNKGKAKKILKDAVRGDAKIDYSYMERVLSIIDDYRKEEEIYKAGKVLSYEFFSKEIKDENSDYGKLIQLYSDTRNLYETIQRLSTEDSEFYSYLLSVLGGLNAFRIAQLRPQFDQFKLKQEEVKTKITSLNEKYPLDEEMLSSPDMVSQFHALTAFVSDDSNSMKLEKTALLNQIIEDLRKNDLGEIIDKLANKEFDYHDVSKVYENAFSYAHIYHYYSDDQKAEYFNSFSSDDYEETIDRYCSLIQDYSNLCVEELKVRLTKSFKETEKNSKVSIGELLKLANSNGRGMTVRNALIKYEDYFRSYFPCFMMSPMACAQLLATDSRKFDIVIFDEASQIPTSEAIGPVARGTSLVVAGDPKQMPPTSYFTATVNASDEEDENGENVALDDSESFLDDCISIGLPSFHLAFHYRSRHESLIQFSNHNFYEDGLFTFPSSDNLRCHISFTYVEVKKKNNGLSEEEEKCIVDTFRNTVLNPLNKGKSIGIIVFNTKQQAKLEETIEALVDKDALLRETLALAEDSYFIKNLENVQGDERDIIIMSVGFSKSASGKAMVNGPLALEKGERRLNVAASRAKEQMIVISTIRSIDIDADKSKNAGPAHLKDFLAYAERASVKKTVAEEKPYLRGISYFIKKDLEDKHSLVADLYVGNSGFKVDLALRKPDTDQYVIGILLDEKPLSDNVSCRDRFFVQSTILKSLNWKIIRVYTVQYHRHPQDTIDKITELFGKTCIELEELEKKRKLESENAVVVTARPLSDKPEISRKPYIQYHLTAGDYLDYEYISKGFYSPELQQLLEKIIMVESPVSFDRILEVVKKSFRITKTGDKAKEIIRKHISNIKDIYVTQDLEEEFYWHYKEGESHEVNYYRGAEDREILDIPKEEIIYLLNCFIQFRGKIDRETLIRQVTEDMSVKSGRVIRDKLLYCIDYAKENGMLKSGYQEEF